MPPFGYGAAHSQNCPGRPDVGVFENYSQGAIRGNTAQIDPRTGQQYWLPYDAPYNQPFAYNGQHYWRNERGFFVWDNSNWLLLQPAR